MKASAIAIVLCLWMNAPAQTDSFEKQALALVQRTLASDLESGLPKVVFTAWVNQQIGPQAGVVWQLTECGEPIGGQANGGKDLRACMEVNAGLPDGRKVIIAILVGTFKKGISGKPALFQAVVESNEQLYEAHLLSELQAMLSDPGKQIAQQSLKPPLSLPVLNPNWMKLRPLSRAEPPLPHFQDHYLLSADLNMIETPPLPSISTQEQDSGVYLEGKATTRVKPDYPSNAKAMNATGVVKVQVTISEDGRVVKAKAISGHMALRSAAVAAAYKWVFKPTTRNGLPLQVQGTLTFDFTPSPR